MTIDVAKFRMPGTKATFGSYSSDKSGTSRQAAVKLTNAVGANKKSNYSLNSKPKTDYVAGQSVSKSVAKYDYTGIRQGLNGVGNNNATFKTRGVSSSANVARNFTIQTGQSNASTAGQVIGQTLSMGISLLNQLGVIGGSKGSQGTSNSKQLDQSFGDLGPQGTASTLSSASANSALSSMSNATNSADLTGAISSAKGTLASMDAIATQNQYETNYTNAQNNMDTLKEGVSKAKEDVSAKKQDVSTAKNSVDAYKSKRDGAKQALSKADAEYGKAVDTYTKAHDAYTDATNKHKQTTSAYNSAKSETAQAKATLDSTPKKITVTNPDGSTSQVDNPAYKTAKANYDSAVKREEQAKLADDAAAKAEKKAKLAETQASKAKDTAKEKLGENKTQVEQLETSLKNEQAKLDKAKEQQTQCETNLKESETKLQESETKLQDAKDAVDKFKDYKSDKEKLSSAIKKQETRLTEMIKKEENEKTKLDNKITQNSEKRDNALKNIDLSDGANKAEYKDSKVAKKSAAKVNRDTESVNHLDMVAQKRTIMSKAPQATINGIQYRQGKINGEVVYFRGNNAIDKAAYEKEIGQTFS